MKVLYEGTDISNYGNIEAWITTQIEAAIYNLKNGAKGATE